MASRSQRAGALLLSACVVALAATSARAAEEPPHPASLDEAIIRSAARHGIPESLVRRVVMRESKYNPRARNHLYWGLMQISYPTAKSMGFKGTPQELLNPVVNLRYAVPYLANAFLIAGKRQDAAVRLYAAGYYDTAKRRGLLGMLRTADSKPLSAVPDEPDQVANLAPPAPPPQDTGIFGALFGPRQMQREDQPQVASADPAQPVATPQPAAAPIPAPAATTVHVASTMDAASDVALVADKNGNLQLPKKWQRDGGKTTIARGEQPIERVAAFKGADESKGGRGRHHKTALFAAIDTQPASAQAYAGPQDQRLTETDSQAAIAQATSGQPAAATQMQQPVTEQPAASATKVADDDTKSRKRHARRSRHKEQPEEAVAQAPAAPAPQSAPAGQPQPEGAAMAPAPQPQAAAEPQPQGQPAPLDASGYPADAGGHQATEAEPAPTKQKRHVAHRAHAHKTAVAAVQDDKPQATPAQQ